MVRLSPSQKVKIVTLVDMGLSRREVARREGISASTVSRLCTKAKPQSSHRLSAKLGRPCLLDDRHKRRISRLVTSGQCQTAIDIVRVLRAEEDMKISVSTVRRALSSIGFKARIKRRKPLLTPEHKKRRLAFARKHQHWTVEDWSRIVWSDESKFELFGNRMREYCWVKHTGTLDPRAIKPTLKHGGGNIMVWGCFTRD